MNRLLTPDAREELTSSPQSQDIAHRTGAFDYLDSIHLCPRYGVISAYILALDCSSVLDIGCGKGSLRRHLPENVFYHGIDSSSAAIEYAQQTYFRSARSSFSLIDIHDFRTDDRYDCVVWAGVGKGCAGEADAFQDGWGQILQLSRGLLKPRGKIVIEHINDYTDIMNSLLAQFSLVSATRLDCASSDAHPKRMVRVVTHGDA